MYSETITQPDGTIFHSRQFTGIDELLDNAVRIDGITGFERSRNSSCEGDYSFTHTSSLLAAIRLGREGWPEGRQRVNNMLNAVPLDDLMTHFDKTVVYQYDVAGDEPDLDRYLAGEPENMIDYMIDTSEIGKQLRLLVNASQHAYVPAKKMDRRGVAVALALDLVTAAGYGVELEMIDVRRSTQYSGGDTIVEYRIPIARAGEYANLDTITFSLVHPSFLRRLMFAANEAEPNDLRQTMGFSSQAGYAIPEYVTLREGERAVVVDKDNGLLQTDSEIPQYALELAKKLLQSAQKEQS